MSKTLSILLLTVLILTSNGCASLQQNKWLKAHRNHFVQLKAPSLSTEQRLDGLLTDYVTFLKEDLKFINPVKGIKYVKKYHDQNLASMDKILAEAASWQSKMSAVDKVAYGARVAKKPYLKDLLDLAPKFKRKYKQYAFATKMAVKMAGGLTGLVGNVLD
jgi:hypothetical protein